MILIYCKESTSGRITYGKTCDAGKEFFDRENSRKNHHSEHEKALLKKAQKAQKF